MLTCRFTPSVFSLRAPFSTPGSVLSMRYPFLMLGVSQTTDCRRKKKSGVNMDYQDSFWITKRQYEIMLGRGYLASLIWKSYTSDWPWEQAFQSQKSPSPCCQCLGTAIQHVMINKRCTWLRMSPGLIIDTVHTLSVSWHHSSSAVS